MNSKNALRVSYKCDTTIDKFNEYNVVCVMLFSAKMQAVSIEENAIHFTVRLGIDILYHKIKYNTQKELNNNNLSIDR